jgi:hypothetical protein
LQNQDVPEWVCLSDEAASEQLMNPAQHRENSSWCSNNTDYSGQQQHEQQEFESKFESLVVFPPHWIPAQTSSPVQEAHPAPSDLNGHDSNTGICDSSSLEIEGAVQYEHSHVERALAGKHIVMIGDSNMRFQYLNLAYFLSTGIKPSEDTSLLASHVLHPLSKRKD